MAVIWETLLLRHRRKEGERLPNRIKLDHIGDKDTLIVEIVVDKKQGITYWYRFQPEQLAGKKAVIFTVSKGEVYWLSGARPQRMYEDELPEKPQIIPVRDPKVLKSSSPTEPSDQGEPTSEVEKKKRKKVVMVFSADESLIMVCADLHDTSKLTHILPESIDKLCKSKKPSQDAGLSFRYLYRKDWNDERILMFSLTLTQYDEMRKRKHKIQATNEE